MQPGAASNMGVTNGDGAAPVAVSVVLQQLHDQAPLAAAILLTVEGAAIWAMLRGAKWAIGL
jgi:hypothetical protein